MAPLNRTLLLPLLLLVSATAPAEEPTVVSLGRHSMSALALRRGIERCQRDAPELPIHECIERFQAPLWRLDQEADQRFKAEAPVRREVESRVLAERLIEVLLASARVEGPAVAAYLQENQAAWATPERLRLFRILVAEKETALTLLRELEHGTPADFRAAARKHSLDQTSHERGGDLGFVAADGSTDLPTVQVDPALFVAARGVENGAFVQQPVAEGDKFAVVWRRGSLAQQRMSEAEAQAWAGERLRQAEVRRSLDQLFLTPGTDRRPDLLARLRRSECKLFAR